MTCAAIETEKGWETVQFGGGAVLFDTNPVREGV
jgi:hypothetical protein